MRASFICNDIYEWIKEKEQYGKMHSIFKNTINILSDDGKFIPIIVSGKPMSPNSILLEEKLDFNDLNIKIGEKVIFKKDRFISEKISISYNEAMLWDKEVKLIKNTDTISSIRYKLDMVKEFILDEGNKDGIFALIKFISEDLDFSQKNALESRSQSFIKDRFTSFVNAFKKDEVNYINHLSKKIIGFGPGLTPSMDDFLSGMMIANIYISYFLGLNLEKAYSLNYEIVKGIENMTTLVSEEMLKLSSLGQANEDIRDFMLSLIGICCEKELEDLLVRLISFGHSSGTDILCGIYIGSYILMEDNLYPSLSLE